MLQDTTILAIERLIPNAPDNTQSPLEIRPKVGTHCRDSIFCCIGLRQPFEQHIVVVI